MEKPCFGVISEAAEALHLSNTCETCKERSFCFATGAQIYLSYALVWLTTNPSPYPGVAPLCALLNGLSCLYDFPAKRCLVPLVPFDVFNTCPEAGGRFNLASPINPRPNFSHRLGSCLRHPNRFVLSLTSSLRTRSCQPQVQSQRKKG